MANGQGHGVANAMAVAMGTGMAKVIGYGFGRYGLAVTLAKVLGQGHRVAVAQVMASAKATVKAEAFCGALGHDQIHGLGHGLGRFGRNPGSQNQLKVVVSSSAHGSKAKRKRAPSQGSFPKAEPPRGQTHRCTVKGGREPRRSPKPIKSFQKAVWGRLGAVLGRLGAVLGDPQDL